MLVYSFSQGHRNLTGQTKLLLLTPVLELDLEAQDTTPGRIPRTFLSI